ncbi:elongation factor Ts [bacterium]|nr:elongation factor Ts [bacterium]
MTIEKELIVKLRNQTGAGLAMVKDALEEASGDMEKALDILRKKGALKAAKKSSERTAEEGIVEAYIHNGGKVGVLLELACETDFVARNEDFKALAHDLTMHIAAAAPAYLDVEDVPAEAITREKDIYAEQLKAEGKPADMLDKIIEGKLESFYAENCLLKQSYIKDESKTVAEVLTDAVTKMGEKIEITRFVRYQI